MLQYPSTAPHHSAIPLSVSLWDTVPDDIKRSLSKNGFKYRIRNHIRSDIYNTATTKLPLPRNSENVLNRAKCDLLFRSNLYSHNFLIINEPICPYFVFSFGLKFYPSMRYVGPAMLRLRPFSICIFICIINLLLNKKQQHVRHCEWSFSQKIFGWGRGRKVTSLGGGIVPRLPSTTCCLLTIASHTRLRKAKRQQAVCL
jgi:hypothetical protein